MTDLEYTSQPPSQVTQLPHAQHEPYPLPTQTLPLKQSIQGQCSNILRK